IDDAAGAPRFYLHLKDVLDLTGPESLDRPIPADRIRVLPVVDAGAELEDALAHIRARGAHVARVTGPGGTTTGMLFLEDIVEELIGEVQAATGAGRGGKGPGLDESGPFRMAVPGCVDRARKASGR